jgi:hypothetical protein
MYLVILIAAGVAICVALDAWQRRRGQGWPDPHDDEESPDDRE